MSLQSLLDPWINTVNTTTVTTPTNTYTLGSTTGQVLTSNGSTGSWTTITSDPNLTGATLKVKGNAEFDGDVVIKGKSIGDSLERIEERLAILRPNEELEKKWDELRKLREAYVTLEKDITEKEQIWNILKR
jgi:hypothetical protein